MKHFEDDKEWRLAKRSFHFNMRELIIGYRNNEDVSNALNNTIKAYEYLFGEVCKEPKD